MRDIRGDLQERAKFVEEQINGAQAQFESLLKELKGEHDQRVADLKDQFDAVKTMMEIEHRRLANRNSPPGSNAEPFPPQAQQSPNARFAPATVRT